MAILVTQPSLPPIEEYIDEIKSIWDSKWLTNVGDKHKCFESLLREYLGVDHVSLFNNGHLALELAIEALELSGEVITTPFTFASTTHAIVRQGLMPVFCDIKRDDYTIDPLKIEGLITEKTTGILPVHVYGNICDFKKIDKIARKYGLKTIYDAAHAFGEKYKGQGIGSFGDITMFSFHATKVFHSIEGGALCFSDEEYAKKFNALKNFGIISTDEIGCVGINAKMNEFQAAMGICNLRHIDSEITKRQRLYQRYYDNLYGINGIKLPVETKDIKRNYAYFPIIVNGKLFGKTRDEILSDLTESQIFARKYFYPLTNSLKCYDGRFNSKETPIAENISTMILTLPLYSELTIGEIDNICEIIKR